MIVSTPLQKLVWLPKKLTSMTIKIPDNFQPKEVWSLPFDRDQDNPPELPIHLVHRQRAWYQDMGHDWNWSANRPGQLRYSSVETKGEHWIIMVGFEEKGEK